MLTKTTKENKSENVSATKIIYGSMSYIDKTQNRSQSFVINGDYYGFEYNDVPYNYIKNLQGDVVAIADGAGNILVQYYYDAWGRILEIDDDSTNSIGTINPIRYRSYYYDTETGFYYLKTRYYSPEICRFLSPDAYVSTGQGVLGYNMFSYCKNSPINNSDHSGHSPIAAGLATLGAIGKVIGIIGQTLIAAAAVLLVTGITVDAITKLTETIEDQASQREHSVYYLYDDDGTVQYVGRTKNVEQRQKAHEKSEYRGHLKMKVIQSNLTYSEARAFEQSAMLYHHTINTANKVNNQINSISPNYWNIFKEIAKGTLEYGNNLLVDEILAWTEI